jgi:Lon protease-like protein
MSLLSAMKSIGRQTSNLPSHVPVMVLPGAVLFPHALMPLFIFEPRYRAMLRHCLERDRMFCMATMKPGITEARNPDDFHHVAGIGLVRACVGHDDGTSHLMLQGLARVEFRGFLQDAPFRIAEVRELTSPAEPSPEAPALISAIRTQCADMVASGITQREAFDEQLAQVRDPAVFCDLAAHTFLRDPRHRQAVLEAIDLIERLRATLGFLEAEARGA